MTIVKGESWSNGGFVRIFHPRHGRNDDHVAFGICVFLCTVSISKSESRSNSRLTEDIHPQHVRVRFSRGPRHWDWVRYSVNVYFSMLTN